MQLLQDPALSVHSPVPLASCSEFPIEHKRDLLIKFTHR